MYDLYVGHVRLFVCLCLSVCRLVALCPHYMYCTDPDVIWENGSGAPYLCIISRFAIGARVSLLWQHSTAGERIECEMSASTCLYSLYAWLQILATFSINI